MSASYSAQIKGLDNVCWEWKKMHYTLKSVGKHIVKISSAGALEMSWLSILFKMYWY